MNDDKLAICNKCKGEIVNKCCDCGVWLDYSEQPPLLMSMEKAILAYNRENIEYPLTGDHHTGTCIILFKGDIELCDNIKKFIEHQRLPL